MVIKSWSLFWVLALVTSAANLLGLPAADFHSFRGMAPLIVRSVQDAIPWFLVAFTASSFAILWPSVLTRWLLANRRYFGLAFAFGMAWHLGFVAYSIWSFGNPLSARSLAFDVAGLVFLMLMTLTSFRWGARHLSPANWRRLHKTGVYVIWLLATELYFHRLTTDRSHAAVFGALIAAGGLRFAAAARQRLSSRNQNAARRPVILGP